MCWHAAPKLSSINIHFFWWLQMNTSLLGIKPPIFGQAKHTFRTGAVWNAHLECATALKDPEHQKSIKLGFWSTAFTIFLARALIFSGCQASAVTALVWSVLVLLTYQTLVEFSKVSRSGPTNICQRWTSSTALLLEKWGLSFNHLKCKTVLRNLWKCMPKQVS